MIGILPDPPELWEHGTVEQIEAAIRESVSDLDTGDNLRDAGPRHRAERNDPAYPGRSTHAFNE